MKAFVDTSAFYAVLDKSDANHNKAAKIWRELLARDALLITTNYVTGVSWLLLAIFL